MDEILNPTDEQLLEPIDEDLEEDEENSESSSNGGEYSFLVTNFVGNAAEATVTLNSVGDGVEISVEASQSVNGIFFNIADDSKLDSLSASGEFEVKDDRKDVKQVGTASIAPKSFEVGVAGGSSVVVSGLTVDDLIGQEFGVRTQSDKLAGFAEESTSRLPDDSEEEDEGDDIVADPEAEDSEDGVSDIEDVEDGEGSDVVSIDPDGDGFEVQSVLISSTTELEIIASLNEQVQLTLETQSFIELELTGQPVDLDDLGDNAAMGSEGDDSVSGTASSDLVSGEDGDDRLLGEGGSDLLVGGDGRDEIDGGLSTDVLSGNTGEDTVSGGEGNDLMYGGQDSDMLLGGEGDDVIDGDLGNDVLMGGGGSDTFVLDDETSIDSILDFEVGIDRLAVRVTQSFTFEVGDFNSDGVTDLAVKLESGFQIATISGVEDSSSVDVVEVPENDYLLA